ncbi:hypothetical protein E3U43_002185 [Larimichthys crocea]|uniref:Uncharacterized protein n=1 Tax=Larimichthys crocea TaxID=215358 RepID=A0ACD3QS36_LARCR|nr:hypothetical protein E3U43_002185 [Larimichthys crocea]
MALNTHFRTSVHTCSLEKRYIMHTHTHTHTVNTGLQFANPSPPYKPPSRFTSRGQQYDSNVKPEEHNTEHYSSFILLSPSSSPDIPEKTRARNSMYSRLARYH